MQLIAKTCQELTFHPSQGSQLTPRGYPEINFRERYLILHNLFVAQRTQIPLSIFRSIVKGSSL